LFHPYGQRPRFARASLALASVLLGRRCFAYNDRDLAEIAQWWLGPERCAAQLPASPAPHSRSFNDTGIITIRRGPVAALFDAGLFGPGSAGHSHSDTLSITLTVDDREILVDSGTFSYMDPEWRPAFRCSAAHNTIRIDGCDQATAAGPFRWTNPPEVKLLEFADEAGVTRATAICCYRGFAHTRTVELTGDQLSITDEIAGPSSEHDIEQFWHFAVEPRPLTPAAWDIDGLAEFTCEGGVLEQSWRSRCFGSKEPAWTIAVRRRAGLPLVVHARLELKA